MHMKVHYLLSSLQDITVHTLHHITYITRITYNKTHFNLFTVKLVKTFSGEKIN